MVFDRAKSISFLGSTSKIGGDHLKNIDFFHGKESIFSNFRNPKKYEYFPFS